MRDGSLDIYVGGKLLVHDAEIQAVGGTLVVMPEDGTKVTFTELESVKAKRGVLAWTGKDKDGSVAHIVAMRKKDCGCRG